MGRAFIRCDRDQVMLLPPDMRSWLAPGHLVWMLIDTVAELDLSAFYRSARRQSRSRPGYDPAMMVTLLLYAYTTGVRSSRLIERRIRDDVAFRVITANHQLDHATIARFRATHADDLAKLFEQVLALCVASGMGRVGVVAVDGTKIAANAGRHRNRTRGELPAIRERLDGKVAAILAEVAAADAADDARYGTGASADDLPASLQTAEARRVALCEARAALAAIARAQEELEARDEATATAHKERLEERKRKAAEQGKALPGSAPKLPLADPAERVNTTDPQSRLQRGPDKAWVQGYNAQIVASDDHLIIAADVSTDHTDQQQLVPMIRLAEKTLSETAPQLQIGTVVADHGYFSNDNTVAFDGDPFDVIIAPGRKRRPDEPPDQSIASCPARQRMHDILQTVSGRERYARRGATVEAVIGNIKHNRNGRRFQRRGLQAARQEWLLMALTHNLGRLLQTRIAKTA